MDLNRKRKTLIFVAICLAHLHLSRELAASAEQMHMPLPGAPCPTSSFGARRTTHIHAGVDFSTGGRIGVPVLAVDTCWVWRISVNNGSYGRALYAVLPNKEVAVYGHLYRFASPMEKAVEAEQNRRGAYEIEIYNDPSTFRFMPGDTIAFSGDTGAGPPHLHFELRSGQYDHDKINPLPRRLDLRENVSPRIRKVRLTPLGYDSAVNGDHKPVTLDPGTAAGPLMLAGAFGASVYTTDTGLCERSLSPTSYEAWIDGEPVWRLDFDEFPFAKGHFVTVFYEMIGGTPYVRLFDPYGLDLDGFDHYAPRSLRFFRDLSGGAHNLTLKVSDVWGNYDQVSIPFTYGALPEFRTFALERDNSGVSIMVAAAEKDCAIDVLYRRSGGAWLPVEVRESSDGRVAHIEGPAPGIEVQCRLTDPSGMRREGVLALGAGVAEIGPASIKTIVHPDYLEIYGYTHTPPSSLPVARVTEGSDTSLCPLQPVSRNVFRGCFFPRGNDQAVHLSVGFEFGRNLVERTSGVLLGLLDKGDDVRLASDRFRVRLVASKDRTFRTFVTLAEDSGTEHTGFDRCEGRLVFEPHEVFFEKGTEVYVTSGEIRLAPRHGLFSEASGRLGFLGAFDSTGTCHARLYTLDPLVILEDSRSPTIKWTGSLARKRNGTGIFTAHVSDGGSGVDSRTVRAFVDDEVAIASYDPDTGKISVRTIKPLPYGRHRLRLEAEDKLGNTGRSEIQQELVK